MAIKLNLYSNKQIKLCKWVNFDEEGNPIPCKYYEGNEKLDEEEFNNRFCQYCLAGKTVEKLTLLRSFFNTYKERLVNY